MMGTYSLCSLYNFYNLHIHHLKQQKKEQVSRRLTRIFARSLLTAVATPALGASQKSAFSLFRLSTSITDSCRMKYSFCMMYSLVV